MFPNGPGDLASTSVRVIPKTQKMVLDATLLNTQHYKVRIKVKWSNPEKGVAPTLHLGVVAIEKGAFELPSTTVAKFTFYYDYIYMYIYIYIYACVVNRIDICS